MAIFTGNLPRRSAFCPPRHGEGALDEEEQGERGSHSQHKDDAARDYAVRKDVADVFGQHFGPAQVLHEHDEGEHRLIGIHARNHGQQGGNIEHRHGAKDALAQQQAAHADGERGAERGRGNVYAQIGHQAEANGMSHGCQQGDGRKGAQGRIGHGAKANGCHGGKQSVGKNICYQHRRNK